MAINWLSSLPLTVDQEGFSQAFKKTVIRSSTDAGPAKVRRRFTANVKPITGKLKLRISDGSFAAFTTFFETTLLDGSLQFTWQDMITGAVNNFRFDTDTSPSITTTGDLVDVSFKLELMP